MGMSMTKYLKPIQSSHLRGKIRKEAFRRGFVMGKIGTQNKEFLAEAIFAIENEFESSEDGRPFDPRTVAMRGVRNRLYDDLGFNESHPSLAAETA